MQRGEVVLTRLLLTRLLLARLLLTRLLLTRLLLARLLLTRSLTKLQQLLRFKPMLTRLHRLQNYC